MKKAFLNKIVIGVIAATTITTLTPLGVSAATNNSMNNNFYNSVLNGIVNAGWNLDNGTWNYLDKAGDVKTGWIKDNGKWYYLDNTGAMQTGVVNINGKTYCLNTSGAMEIGKVIVNNKTYKCSSDGQVAGTKIPTADKVFDSNNTVVKDNNQNSTVNDSNNNQGTTNSGNTDITTTGSTTNTDNTTTKNTGNTTTSGNSTSTGNTTTTDNTNATTAGSTNTTNNTSTDVTAVDVQGLPQLPKTYAINVQANVEDKILELMNAKRTEAGLKPLTKDNTLVQVARYKSDHMIQYNYFDHVTPQGTKYTDWLQSVGYTYSTAGENIAYNTYDAVELFTQWWNSPGHRANMMNASFTKVGIGVVQGNGKYMGTQEFSN